MSTLRVVEEVLRERGVPMVVREIVEHAAERLPTRSKTPDTVVARDLAMDIKKLGDDSRFTRVAPGRYTLRELVHPAPAAASQPAAHPDSTESLAAVAVTQGPAPNPSTEASFGGS